MLTTLKILSGTVLGLALSTSAFAQSETAAEKKCAAFQQQVKDCNAAMGSPATNKKIPPGCAAILKKAAIKPCG